MKKQKHHAWYLVLGSIAALLLVALYYSRGNNQVQFYIVSLFVAIYVIWGILHHKMCIRDSTSLYCHNILNICFCDF